MADSALSNAKVIFVLGGPGSGKGTQCEMLIGKYGFNHLSSGDLLRAEIASGSERGQSLKSIMERGELVSLDTVLSLIKDAMIKLIGKSCYFLIDGYPRELEQGFRFEKEIAPCMCVLCFEVSEEIMRQRLLKRSETSGRVDDNEETIVKRFRVFNDLTKPVIAHYKEKNKLIMKVLRKHYSANGQLAKLNWRWPAFSAGGKAQIYAKQIDGSQTKEKVFQTLLVELKKYNIN